jgi:hypothetical protein
MTGRRYRVCRHGALCTAIGAMCLVVASGLSAQTPATPPAASIQPAPSAQPAAPIAPVPGADPPAAQPGAIETFGTWMQEGVSNMGTRFGAMVGSIGGQANQAAKDATDVTLEPCQRRRRRSARNRDDRHQAAEHGLHPRTRTLHARAQWRTRLPRRRGFAVPGKGLWQRHYRQL